MTFDCKLEDANIIISCSKGLESFSREFIYYYNRRIDRIRDELDIADNIKVKVFLTDDEKNAGFMEKLLFQVIIRTLEFLLILI